MPVPQIPGVIVNSNRTYELIGRVAELCHMESKRYLPVALSSRNTMQQVLLGGEDPYAGGLQLHSAALSALRLTFHRQVPRQPANQLLQIRYRPPRKGRVSPNLGSRISFVIHPDSFWVCEKSDGIRVLFFIQLVEGAHDVYLVGLSQLSHTLTTVCTSPQIDRKNKYYLQEGFFFPHYTKKELPMRDTILDGELVLDTPPGSKNVCSSWIFTLSFHP